MTITEAQLKLLAHADGELSAIAHGRPPSDKAELLRLSAGLREMYDAWRRAELAKGRE